MFLKSDAMLCSITRIKVEKLAALISIIFSFLRMKKQSQHISGLLEVSMLLRKDRTVIFISLWQDSDAMTRFGSIVHEHSFAVRKIYRSRTEFWSGIFTLQKMSPKTGLWADVSVQTAQISTAASNEREEH